MACPPTPRARPSCSEEEEEWEKPVVPSSESESEHEDAPLSEDEEEVRRGGPGAAREAAVTLALGYAACLPGSTCRPAPALPGPPPPSRLLTEVCATSIAYTLPHGCSPASSSDVRLPACAPPLPGRRPDCAV